MGTTHGRRIENWPCRRCKKRLKLARLWTMESKVGRSPMSGGSRSVVGGIGPAPVPVSPGRLGPPGNDGPVESESSPGSPEMA